MWWGPVPDLRSGERLCPEGGNCVVGSGSRPPVGGTPLPGGRKLCDVVRMVSTIRRRKVLRLLENQEAEDASSSSFPSLISASSPSYSVVTSWASSPRSRRWRRKMSV